MQVWFDGKLMLPSGGNSNQAYWQKFPVAAAAGKIHWSPDLTLHYKGFQLFYYDRHRDLSGEMDRSGYYSGIQVDDLEVWNGLPPHLADTVAPARPSNLRIQSE